MRWSSVPRRRAARRGRLVGASVRVNTSRPVGAEERLLTVNPTSARLTSFYGELSPGLETIRAALAAAGIDQDHIRARDLYDRDLDCHNLGMHAMLDILANIVVEHRPPRPEDHVLDVGCGLGGPGRFLVDRFGCSIVGVDLLPERVALAEKLTDMCGMDRSISYRAADATELPFDDGSF